jgi:hypothetical protein
MRQATILRYVPILGAVFSLFLIRGAWAGIVEYQNAVRAVPSLVSYYTFDADSTSVTDTQDGNNGTLAGSGTTFPVGGFLNQGGKSLLLNGSGHVNLGTVSAFNFPGDKGTVEAWIRADWTSIGYEPVVFAVREGGATRISLHAGAGRNTFGTWNGGTYSAYSASLGSTWHHVAFVYDGTNPSTKQWLYVDGTLIGTNNNSLGTAGQPAEIGSNASTGGERWLGGIDELAVYSNALSAATIQTHMMAWQTTPLLDATWDFESGTRAGWEIVANTGSAFNNQPTNSTRSPFNKQGTYFVGTYEGVNGDGPTGILEGSPFLLGPDAALSFLVGGGNHPWSGTPDSPGSNVASMNLERWNGTGWEVLRTATGADTETMAPVFWDLRSSAGSMVRLRIYDTSSGGWGHINVDNIVLSQIPEPSSLVLLLLGLAMGLPARCLGRGGWRRASRR